MSATAITAGRRNCELRCRVCAFGRTLSEEHMGRAILLLLLGVPIPIIILLALIWH
jgi:hypothetical protein